MASSCSRVVIGDIYVDDLSKGCGNVSKVSRPAGVFFYGKTSRSHQKASMSLKNEGRMKSHLAFGYFTCDAMRRNFKCNPFDWLWLSNSETSFSKSNVAGSAPDASFETSLNELHISNSAVLLPQNIVVDRSLRLVSGSSYLPHPDKEEKGGEDAHFICGDEQAIGVADGVGGWADVGVDSGVFARELMSNSVSAIQEEPKGSTDPAKVLEKAHSSTKAKGSSTACIIALTNQGINAINLGDSGFIIVRDGCTVFQSPVQQHGFNFPYQLESGYGGDLPSSGQVFTIPVAPGDVIIAGTDGLFDNLFENEVSSLVTDAVRSGLGPQETAQRIATSARGRALNRKQETPFSTAAQQAGFRYYGGKLDDITVVVSYITRSADV